jgi:hypothetical protein
MALSEFTSTPLENPTGKQSELALGCVYDPYYDYDFPFTATVAFSDTDSSNYVGSIVEKYVNDYKMVLEVDYDVDVVDARLISYDELTSPDIGCVAANYTCKNTPKFITKTTYWTGSPYDSDSVWFVYTNGSFLFNRKPSKDTAFGVRPVIVISKDYFD